MDYSGWSNKPTWLLIAHEFFNYVDIEIFIENAIGDDKLNDLLENLTNHLKDEFNEFKDQYLPENKLIEDLLEYACSEISFKEISEQLLKEIDIFIVSYNMPGYMPDAEPAYFTDYTNAQEYLKSVIKMHCEEADIDEDDEIVNDIITSIDALEEGEEFGYGFYQYIYKITKSNITDLSNKLI